MFTLLLDPGHGGSDPGVYDKKRDIAEKDANLRTALTLKWLLVKELGDDIKVKFTRTIDFYPSLSRRTKNGDYDAFLSIHYDWARGFPMVYYASEKGSTMSYDFGHDLAKALGDVRLWPTEASRFGRLYIDDVPSNKISVLWEVDRITNYQDTAEYRIEKCVPVVKFIKKWIKF